MWNYMQNMSDQGAQAEKATNLNTGGKYQHTSKGRTGQLWMGQANSFHSITPRFKGATLQDYHHKQASCRV